jgi:hypothetical protein
MVAEDTAAVYQHLKLVVLVMDFRADAMFRNQFALEAAGQASEAGSNQAAANLDSRVRAHPYFFTATSTLAVVSAQSSFKTAAFALV